MKTPKLFHLVALFVVVGALLFFPTSAEAVVPGGDSPWVKISGKDSLDIYTGKYFTMDVSVSFCDGKSAHDYYVYPSPNKNINISYRKVIKSYVVDFSVPGTETLSGCSGECGCDVAAGKKVSHCGGFSIASRAPNSPAVPVTFKGSAAITSASIYFKDLGYSLPLWLFRYDWGSGRWYAYLNTLPLPTGKHHGRLITSVNGTRGGGCATGGFKVVSE